jgi:hypothetical protein
MRPQLSEINRWHDSSPSSRGVVQPAYPWKASRSGSYAFYTSVISTHLVKGIPSASLVNAAAHYFQDFTPELYKRWLQISHWFSLFSVAPLLLQATKSKIGTADVTSLGVVDPATVLERIVLIANCNVSLHFADGHEVCQLVCFVFILSCRCQQFYITSLVDFCDLSVRKHVLSLDSSLEMLLSTMLLTGRVANPFGCISCAGGRLPVFTSAWGQIYFTGPIWPGCCT